MSWALKVAVAGAYAAMLAGAYKMGGLPEVFLAVAAWVVSFACAVGVVAATCRLYERDRRKFRERMNAFIFAHPSGCDLCALYEFGRREGLEEGSPPPHSHERTIQ